MTTKWLRIYEERGLGCATKDFAFKVAAKLDAIVLERDYIGGPAYKVWPSENAVPLGWVVADPRRHTGRRVSTAPARFNKHGSMGVTAERVKKRTRRLQCAG